MSEVVFKVIAEEADSCAEYADKHPGHVAANAEVISDLYRLVARLARALEHKSKGESHE